MRTKEISDGIKMLSMNVEDILFEGMWELAKGVTLNSYLVQGDKTAIIDGVIGWDGITETLYEKLEEIDVKPENINYLVINHMEPDHSGYIQSLKSVTQDLKIICSKSASLLLDSFYDIKDGIIVVKDGDTVDLGQGKKLTFYTVPNVHWPDTMFTYEESSKTLFSCDMYGAFGIMDEHVFDDEMTLEELTFFESEGIRYYSNVMATFNSMVKKAIQKTKELDINIIAPGHGPVYRANPTKIIDDYTRFTKYSEGYGKNEITILWGSMYGMTAKAVRFLEKYLVKKGIKVNMLKMPQESHSEMIATVFKSAAIIIAAPTYEYKMFPPIATALDELGRKKVSNKVAFRFGSYGWSGGAERELSDILDRNRMKWDLVESVEFNGSPKEEDFEKIISKADILIEKMQSKII